MSASKAYALCLLASLSSGITHANEDKTWFNSFNYMKIDADNGGSTNSKGISSHYYFAEQSHSGVWDDFGYLDTDTNIQLAYQDREYNDLTSFNSEVFFGSMFVTAGAADLDHADDNYQFGLGYLFADALKVSVSRYENKYDNDQTVFQAAYNHQINESDYLGMTLNTDDDLEDWNASTRYFTKLENGQHVTVDIGYFNNEFDSESNIMATWYPTINYSFGIGYSASATTYTAKYFFNDSYYISASHSNTDFNKLFDIGFVAQF